MAHLMTQKVSTPFPHLHIKNIGGGTVGPLCIRRDASGAIVSVEAELLGAPFKRMLITSPRLLQIFEGDGKRINLENLKHPWPQFRLVEQEKEVFDVGILTEVELVRADYEFGHLPKSFVSGKRIETRPSSPKQNAPQSPVLEERVSPQARERHDRKPSRRPLEEVDLLNSTIDFTPYIPASQRPPAPYTPVSPINVDISAITANMNAVKAQILALLSSDDQEQYNFFLDTGIKRMGKQGHTYRERMRLDIRNLFRKDGVPTEEIIRLHNQYAELQNKIEKRWPYHLPVLEPLIAED